MVLPYIHMNPPQVYMCSPSWSPLPPPSPSHPSGPFQCTSPKHPVSYIKPGLVIYFTYDNTHVSMPFSQIIPPSPSPTEFKRQFYTSVSLLLSCIQGYNYHLSTFWPSVFFTILSSPVPVAIVASLCLWGHCPHYCISQDLCPSSLQRRLISHIWIWVTKDQVAYYLLGGLANKSNINLNSVKATYREITYQWFQSKRGK